MFVLLDQKRNDTVPFGGTLKLKDMNELEEKLSKSRRTGLVDIQLLALENPGSYLNPAEKILARTVKVRLIDLDQSRLLGVSAYTPANFSDAEVGEIDNK